MKKKLNQKLINLIEYYSIFNANLLLSDKPIKRIVDNQASKLSFSGTKIQKLEKLRKKISEIKNCDLKKNATNIVFGDGNISANVMIVGEGPGAQEDIVGKPFIGRAGKLLDKMLESINLNREKVYISNIVNYRPPENRRPTDSEISTYLQNDSISLCGISSPFFSIKFIACSRVIRLFRISSERLSHILVNPNLYHFIQ